jgi:hypothetical protein
VLRAELDPGFILTPMPAAAVKGFAEPVLTYAVEGRSAHTETGGPKSASTIESRFVCLGSFKP